MRIAVMSESISAFTAITAITAIPAISEDRQ